MPRIIKLLSPTQVRNLKPQSKPYRLFDGKSMYIEVLPSGIKNWRMKYRKPDKKEKAKSTDKSFEFAARE